MTGVGVFLPPIQRARRRKGGVLPMSEAQRTERFWSMVYRVDGECWPWLGARRTPGRYGVFGIGSDADGQPVMESAHRIAWMLTHGQIPDGFFVCHHCDAPACCNPGHLFIGTNSDNQRDAVRKGRGRWRHYKGTSESAVRRRRERTLSLAVAS